MIRHHINEGFDELKCYTDTCHVPEIQSKIWVLEHSHQVENNDWEKGLYLRKTLALKTNVRYDQIL